MMMQIIPAVLALIALLAMVICGISILRKREIEQELDAAYWQVRYHQKESEINLSVAQAITNTVAHRLMSVFGRDYVDYLAARQMNLPDFRQPEPEQDDTPFIVTYGDGRGRNLTGDSCQEWEERRAREEEYLLRQYQQSGYTPPVPPTMPPRPQTRAARFERPHTPPQQWQPQPQCPVPPCRNLPYWADDDDVLDVEVYPSAPVYPPALLPAPHQGNPQRKYASNAERQRAYRERKKARNR